MSKSFYGGKEGRSFEIVKEFQSVAEMVAKFKEGPSYKEVNFDEYVLINTVNKNNPENGNIYRRGYDFDSDRYIDCYNMENGEGFYSRTIAGGAIFIGSIVGPAGAAPHLELGSYQDAAKGMEPAEFRVSYNKFPKESAMLNFLAQKCSENGVPVDFDNNVLLNEDGESLGQTEIYNRFVKFITEKKTCYFYFDSSQQLVDGYKGWYQVNAPKGGAGSYTLEDGDLLSGVEYEIENGRPTYTIDKDTGKKHLKILTENQDIHWAYYSVKDANNAETVAKIGFKIPVHVVEYEAESVEPYFNRPVNAINNLNLVQRVDNLENPFYSKWELKIPRGLDGDSISSLYVMTYNKGDNVVQLDLDDNGQPQYDDKRRLKTKGYSDERANVKIIVFDYTTLKGDSTTPVTRTIYLADYDAIVNISIAEDGTVKYLYTNRESIQNEKLNWVNQVSIAQDGTVTNSFNNPEKTPYVQNDKLKWMEYVRIEADGTYKIKFNDGEEEITDQKFSWVNNVSIADDGTYSVGFNTGITTTEDKKFEWVKDVSIADDGTYTINYNTGDFLAEYQKMNWIKSASYNEATKDLKIEFNNNNIQNINCHVKQIVDVERRADAGGDQLVITMSDGTKKIFSGLGSTYVGEITSQEESIAVLNHLPPGGACFIVEEME